MKMVYTGAVCKHVRKFFNPEEFKPSGFRDTVTRGMMGFVLAELVVYIQLQKSADIGELPHNITDLVIVSVSLLEFLVIPLFSWLGSRQRRSVLVGWTVAALLCTAPLFALPDPEITADAGLCTASAPRSSTTSVSAKTAVRVAMLLVCGLVSALARAVHIAHGIAYLDENRPSDNLHMHVGIFLLHRVLIYLMASSLKSSMLETPWLQILILIIKYLVMLLRLYRYPETASTLRKESRSDKGFIRSMARVLANPVAVLQILGMSSLASAWWGFGMHEKAFVQVKYYIRPLNDSSMGVLNSFLRLLSVLIGVPLAGYIYTSPVMPKFDRKAAVASSAKISLLAAMVYVLMTAWLSCNRSELGRLGHHYSQPVCVQNCGCDRPWIEFHPVCVSEQMTTYFSPCHAGCSTAETVSNIGVYSNCTCAAGGRATIGACDDGSCASAYSLHQTLYVVVSLASILAFAWQTTVLLESVDKREVAVALGLASGVVSLMAFAGAHAVYMSFSYTTCAFTHGTKCLLQNDLFPPMVGYSSAGLAGLSLTLAIISCIVLRRQKEPKIEELSV